MKKTIENRAYSWKTLGALVIGAVIVAASLVTSTVAPADATGTQFYDPECSFNAKEGRTIVNFKNNGDYPRLLAKSPSVEFSVSLPAGNYKVSADSFDGYSGRKDSDPTRQDHEQWNVVVYAGGTKLSTLGPTADLEDGVNSASRVTVLANSATFSSPVTKLKVAHAFPHLAPEPHSVVPVCVAFDKIPDPTPKCPITLQNGEILVDFGTGMIRSDKSASDAQKGPFNVSLPKGKYHVQLASYDDHTRKAGQTQPNEQWYLELWTGTSGGGSNIVDTNSIADLPDHLDYLIQSVNSSLMLTSDIKSVVAKHTAYSASNPNSIVPMCAAFKKVEELPEPDCSMWADRTKVKKGEPVQIGWSSKHMTALSFNKGIGAKNVNGSMTQYPTEDTSYTGTFTDIYGETMTCKVHVKVEEPKVPTCELFSNFEYPTLLTEGETAKIWWKTENASSIPGGYYKMYEKKPLTGVHMQPESGDIYSRWSDTFFDLNTSSFFDYVTVTPTRDTDYWGFLYDSNGTLIDSCPVEIDLKKKEKEPRCDAMSLIVNGHNKGSSATVTKGQSTKIELAWNTSDATQVRLYPPSSGTVVAADVSVSNPYLVGTFTPNSNVEYRIKVLDANDAVKDECKVQLKVETPPCTDCGGGHDQPRVELSQKYQPATSSPLAFVSLTQVPYTGFEAGPIATALFWSILALWSIAVGYSMIARGGWQRLYASVIPSPYVPEFSPPVMAGGNTAPSREVEYEYEEEEHDHSISARGIPPHNLPGADEPSPTRFGNNPTAPHAVVPEVQAAVSIERKIEEAAYTEKMLVSVDAIAAVATLAGHSIEAIPETMKSVIEKAKATYPRVDGWIHLTRERIAALFPAVAAAGRKEYGAAESVSAPTPRVASEVRNTESTFSGPVDTQAAQGTTDPAAMIAHLVMGSEEQAFKTLRSHLAAGQSVQSLFADMASAVDAVYRSRIEGGPADRRVAERLSSWKTEDVEGLLAILSGGLDYSYTTPQTAGKITLAKLFEFARGRSK